MEGLVFGAGPWFTVQTIGSGWQPLGKAWLGNGETDGPARVEASVRFDDQPAPEGVKPAPEHAAAE